MYGRIWCGQDRKHEESDSILSLRRSIKAQVIFTYAVLGKKEGCHSLFFFFTHFLSKHHHDSILYTITQCTTCGRAKVFTLIELMALKIGNKSTETNGFSQKAKPFNTCYFFDGKACFHVFFFKLLIIMIVKKCISFNVLWIKY